MAVKTPPGSLDVALLYVARIIEESGYVLQVGDDKNPVVTELATGRTVSFSWETLKQIAIRPQHRAHGMVLDLFG